MKRRGLGRGLEALIPGAGGAAAPVELPVDSLHPGAHQPRHQFDPSELESLADSIRRHGLLQPIVVEPDQDGYRIIAGERRWRASRAAGLTVVPVTVRQASASSTLELSLVENIQRADLNPIDEAEAIRALIRAQALTQEEAAQRLGRSQPAVANSLRLLELPKAVREAVAARRLTAGHARAIMGSTDPATVERLAEEVVRRGLSVREAEELGRRSRPGPRPARQAAGDGEGEVETRALARQVAERIGLPTRIVRGARRGSLTVTFTSDEELDALVQLLLD